MTTHGPHHTHGDHYQMVRACEVDVEEESEKMAVVEVSDAVVDPRTMVI